VTRHDGLDPPMHSTDFAQQTAISDWFAADIGLTRKNNDQCGNCERDCN